MTETLKDVLVGLLDSVWHRVARPNPGDRYIVWAEDGEGSAIAGDNVKLEQSIQGQIHYFTRKESDPNVEEIQKALGMAKISFYLDAVQYEDETKYIHYSWVFEVS